MNNWFECKVKFEKIGEDGISKKVSEPYLVSALSFTEAEQRVIKEVTPFVSGEFSVNAVKKSKIAELFYSDWETWYRAKVNFISLNEEKGIEKKTAVTMMVQADNIAKALGYLVDKLSSTLSDWEIASISETAIIEVYTYNENN